MAWCALIRCDIRHTRGTQTHTYGSHCLKGFWHPRGCTSCSTLPPLAPLGWAVWGGKVGDNYSSHLRATNSPGWLDTLQKVPFRGEECGLTQHRKVIWEDGDRTGIQSFPQVKWKWKVLNEQCPFLSCAATGTTSCCVLKAQNISKHDGTQDYKDLILEKI